MSASPQTQVDLTQVHATGTRQRVASYLVGGAGLAGAALGTALIVSGWTQATSAKSRGLVAVGEDYDRAKADHDAGRTRNWIGWGVGSAGLAAVVFGVVLYATTPKVTNRSVRITPGAMAEGGWLIASGSW